MAAKKKSRRGIHLLRLVLLLPSIVSVISKITKLIHYEARQASQSIGVLIAFAVIFAVISFSAWLCVLAIVLMYLLSLHVSVLLSLSALLGLNLLILIICCFVMAGAKKKLSFPITRQKVRDLCDTLRD